MPGAPIRLGFRQARPPPRLSFTFDPVATYKIVRMYMHGRSRAVPGLSGLTLEQAQAHCANPETSSRTATSAPAKRRTRQRGPWFDAYTQEG